MEAECSRVLAVRQELVDAVKAGLGANTQELWKARRACSLARCRCRACWVLPFLLLCSSPAALLRPAVHHEPPTDAYFPPPPPSAPRPLAPQLRRRAGIPTDAASDETYAAFTEAVAEHEKQLRAQLAGERAREGGGGGSLLGTCDLHAVAAWNAAAPDPAPLGLLPSCFPSPLMCRAL